MSDAARRLGAGLTRSQHEAVFSDASPLCIVAGAGSGKTLVLTRRIARVLAEDPEAAPHTVAVTFTRKAAGELTGRLGALGVSDDLRRGTFHALAYRAISEHRRLRGLPERRVVEHKAALVAEAMRGPRGRGADRRSVSAVAAEIARARARRIGPEDLEAWAGDRCGGPALPVSAEEFARVYRSYEDLKARRGVLDFEDLLEGWADLFEHDRAFANAPVRRIDHVFVDEFQDVNPAQFHLLHALVGPPAAPTPPTGPKPAHQATLCAVGDDDQAIYGFGGAEASYLTGFGDLWPDAVTVRLEDNFRCPPQVLRVANAVLSEARGRRGKVLRPKVPDGPAPELASHTDERAEAAWIARTLPRVRRPGASWRSCAVLARTNRQLDPIRDALTAAGIPTVVRAGTALVASPAVRDVLDRLRTGAHRDALAPGMPFAALVAELAGLDVAAALWDTGTDPGSWDDDDPDLAALIAAAAEYELSALDSGGGTSAEGFTTWLRTTVGAEPAGVRADAVSLLTMHRAKGLEFDVVIVAGLEEGLMPIAHASSPADLEEERRLLYVALTRSRRRLLLSWSRTRALGGEVRDRKPSRMLAAVAASLSASAGEHDPAPGWRNRLTAARTAVRADASVDAADTDLLAGLRDWRDRTAAREGIPAHLVLHDSTLRRIAGDRPADHVELARVADLGRPKRSRYGAELLEIVASAGASATPARA